jgi:hypothetical protein
VFSINYMNIFKILINFEEFFVQDGVTATIQAIKRFWGL